MYPVCEVGNTDSETRGGPSKPTTSSVHYFKPAPNRNGMDSPLPEKEVQLGKDKPTLIKYTVPSMQQNAKPLEFRNPIYSVKDTKCPMTLQLM